MIVALHKYDECEFGYGKFNVSTVVDAEVGTWYAARSRCDDECVESYN